MISAVGEQVAGQVGDPEPQHERVVDQARAEQPGHHRLAQQARDAAHEHRDGNNSGRPHYAFRLRGRLWLDVSGYAGLVTRIFTARIVQGSAQSS
jgi:hypothetical protein